MESIGRLHLLGLCITINITNNGYAIKCISTSINILNFSAEFTSIAKWVANSDVDPHMVEVVYALLDEDGDRNLSVKEFSPVLFQWRRSRGFQHQNLQISMGQLQI